MRLLIVDDDRDVRITSCLLLEHYGHCVAAADGGEAAIAMAGANSFDAILLDLNMPGMDGFETARKLRELPLNAAVLIIAVSGYVADKVWCDRAIAAGVDECLGKPMDYGKLETLLGRRHSLDG